jgi:hypothetical protein
MYITTYLYLLIDVVFPTSTCSMRLYFRYWLNVVFISTLKIISQTTFISRYVLHYFLRATLFYLVSTRTVPCSSSPLRVYDVDTR